MSMNPTIGILGSLLMVFATIPALGADLQEDAKASEAYSFVSVQRYVGDKMQVKFTPQMPTSAGLYEGEVEITVAVEGNICAADPQSLGVIIHSVDQERRIGLVVKSVAPRSRTLCLLYSKSTIVSFVLPIKVYEFEGESTDESLGVVAYYGSLGGGVGRKDIRFVSSAGVANIVVVDLK